jgi:replication factor C subunit 1
MCDGLWINKYKPITIHNIIGNQVQIEKIKIWLNNLHTNSNSLIITGHQGIGKTHIMKLILKEYNYLVRVINPNDIKDHRIFDDFNDYYNHKNSIYAKHNIETQGNKVALIFDEIENITLNSEKKYVMNIYKDNNKQKLFPLIFISNNQHSKLLNDLKRNCTEVILSSPTHNELKKFIQKIIINENITFTSPTIYDKLINFAQSDIRRLLNLLQELSFHTINNTITDKIIDEFIIKSREKNMNIGLINSTKKILNYYLDYDTIIKLYETEKVLLPLLIHENYPKKILSKLGQKGNINTILNNMINISNSISVGDNIETSIYTDQNWYLQNIHGFYTCINTSYWINQTNKNNILDYSDVKFSADLNKTSLKNINRKNILNLSKIINNKSNQDILMLNTICNHLMTTDETELLNILKTYNKNLTIKEIELCLKIDKTTEYNILATKDKKRLIKQIV